MLVAVFEKDHAGIGCARAWAEREKRVRIVYVNAASRSRARNAAVLVAYGDWCYFLDDDAEVFPDTVSALREAVRANPEACAIGGPNHAPKHCGVFERCVEEVLCSPLGAATMRRRYRVDGEAGYADERSFIACNLAIRRDAVLREKFPEQLCYGEETLLLARLRRGGARLFYDPAVRVAHRRRLRWADFARQAYLSGQGRGRQTRRLPSSFHAEFSGPPLLALATATAPVFRPSLIFLALYAAACAGQGVVSGLRLGPGSGIRSALLTAVGHYAFGLGLLSSLCGPDALRSLLFGETSWRSGFAACAHSLSRYALADAAGRGYYRIALKCLKYWSGRPPLSVRALWLRRSVAGTDWTPGASDIDLALELPEMSFAEEAAWLKHWHSGYARLRAYFPVLGEVQIARRDEWRDYRRNGDIRSVELFREAKMITGERFVRNENADIASWEKKALDAWTEQAHALVRLTGLYFLKGSEKSLDLRQARKALADIFRYGALVRGDGDARGWIAVSRLESLREAEDFGVSVEEAALRGFEEISDCARIVNARLGSGDARPVWTPTVSCEREARAFDGLYARLSDLWGDGLFAAHDNARRFLLEDRFGSLEERRRGWRRLKELRAQEPSLQSPLFPLSKNMLRPLLAGPFDEDPWAGAAVCAVSGKTFGRSVLAGRSGLLERYWLSVRNAPDVSDVSLPRALTEAAARECLAHLRVNWRDAFGRGVGGTDFSRWFYLYGRMMSLRLYLDEGEIIPPFFLEELTRRFAESRPGTVRALGEYVLRRRSVEILPGEAEFFADQLGSAGRVRFEV